jgi:hypothetical protein
MLVKMFRLEAEQPKQAAQNRRRNSHERTSQPSCHGDGNQIKDGQTHGVAGRIVCQRDDADQRSCHKQSAPPAKPVNK